MIVYIYILWHIITNISITWDESKSTPENVSYQVSSHPNVSHSPRNGWISSWAVSVVTRAVMKPGHVTIWSSHGFEDAYGYLWIPCDNNLCSESRVVSTYSRKMLSNLLEHGSSCGPSLLSLPTKKLPLMLLIHHDLHFSGILDMISPTRSSESQYLLVFPTTQLIIFWPWHETKFRS